MSTSITTWTEDVARRLLDVEICPACSAARLHEGRCPACGADLSGDEGIGVWRASEEAARMLRARDALLQRVPRLAAAPPRTAAPLPQPAAPRPAPAEARAATGGNTSLQSVLAVAGAGLFGIAAIVFTFLNPDLTDRALRSGVVALVTLLFLGASLLLARRGLQFSAEAIGALGLVFVCIDVWAFAQLGAGVKDTWLLASLATAIAAAALAVGGSRVRIRSWSWGGLLGLSLVPAMLGYAAGDTLGAAIGHLGTAFFAGALASRTARIGGFARGTSVAVQLVGVLTAPVLTLASFLDEARPVSGFAGLAVVFALAAVHAASAARHAIPRLWSFLAGGAAVGAVVSAVHAVEVTTLLPAWWWALLGPVSVAAFGSIALVRTPPGVRRAPLASGALVLPALLLVVPLGYAVSAGLRVLGDLVTGASLTGILDTVAWPYIVALLGASVVLAVFGRLASGRGELQKLRSAMDAVAVIAAAAAVFAFASLPVLPIAPRILIVLAAIALTAVLHVVVGGRPAGGATAEPVSIVPARIALIIAMHLLLAAAAALSWSDAASAPAIGAAVLIVLALVARSVPSNRRFLHVGAGFGYALICLAAGLGFTALSPVAVLCLTTSAGLIGAIVATYLRGVQPASWYAILVVTSVPFMLGIAQVIVERSGWTALSTGLMWALCLALLLTSRPGLTALLRVAAAALLVPAASVVVLCLGAQLLATSGSPVVLPVIAVMISAVLGAGEPIVRGLRRAGRGVGTARAARIAIEASALLTGAIAVGLALVREAAGLGTAAIVLLVLAVGGAAAALLARRRYGWWLAGTALTGALWCGWGIAGVTLVEAYVLPPAIGAALLGMLLTLRGGRGEGLWVAGLGAAILPSLALAIAEADAGDVAPWRPLALLTGAWALAGVGALCARSGAASGQRIPAHVAAMLAALAGPVLGARLGLGTLLPGMHGLSLFALCAAAGVLAAAAMALAASGIRGAAAVSGGSRAARWLSAPAAIALAASTWPAIERDWGAIWAMWALSIALLTVMVVAATRSERTVLPPVWLLFALAFVTAIVAWSPRDLRVEWFSLPLGAFLLIAGSRGMRDRAPAGAGKRSLDAWPSGRGGSWRLLAPGIVVMMSASVVATFTDPLTWRAVLVMVLALAAILVGAARRLAAPFVIGMIVLPIENVFVFAVQIGRGIESMPWWITLAVIGAVLLILAVTYERKDGGGGARMRDLR
ncbi:SCO7613 C-terminal domain-containing membrane protein [Microbacterium sp. NPDC055903]